MSSRAGGNEQHAEPTGVLDPDEGEEIEGEVVQALVAMAIDDALGDFDMSEVGDGPPDFYDDGKSLLTSAECVTCLAALVKEKPRRWDEARKLINEKNKNRRFRTPREKEELRGEAKERADEKIRRIKARTKCAICKEPNHWAAECPQKGTAMDKKSPLYKANMMGSVYVESESEAETSSKDLEDECLSDGEDSLDQRSPQTVSTRATWKSAMLAMNTQYSSVFKHDLSTPRTVGYGAIDTACGFCVMGADTIITATREYAEMVMKEVGHRRKCDNGGARLQHD